MSSVVHEVVTSVVPVTRLPIQNVTIFGKEDWEKHFKIFLPEKLPGRSELVNKAVLELMQKMPEEEGIATLVLIPKGLTLRHLIFENYYRSRRQHAVLDTSHFESLL